LAQHHAVEAASELFARISKAPAVQSLARRLEKGGSLSCNGVSPAAQPFLAACLHQWFPRRPIIVVTDNLKSQETFEQDLETWLGPGSREPNVESREKDANSRTATPVPRLLFYPEWEILPHDARLPHADTITDRLETLVRLNGVSDDAAPAPVVITTASALLQRTFAPDELRARTRTCRRGDRIDPLDLVEWLEDQGYEPEAQVSQKGELSMRGGILDIYPMTSPWPVRLEFFGDELESLRYFDPVTQMSREAVETIVIPPGGELGILKGTRNAEGGTRKAPPRLATLLDYLPAESIFVLCEPPALEARAEEYTREAPADDPFIVRWAGFIADLDQRGFTRIALEELGMEAGLEGDGACPAFQSLDAYRPLAERGADVQVVEAQRREFFEQLHRWLRQGYSISVFCNNEGERQRFQEVWKEQAQQSPESEVQSPKSKVQGPKFKEKRARSEGHWTLDIGLWTVVGGLSHGFVCEAARVVVVTDAEIFGRYKIQRPRRLKSPHAAAARSALDIDFTDLEDGDLVVHLQHGIGRYLGLKTLPATAAGARSENRTPEAETECLVIEYAASDPAQPAPKLYVPVTEAHLVSKYVGAGKVRPPLNTLGGTRWNKAKEHAERAVRDVAGDLLSIQAARESQSGHPFKPDTAWQREFESAFIYEETPDQLKAIQETKADMERPKSMDRLICGDVGFGKTEVAIRAAFKAVMDGKQVAVLVPTTVLAQQHFNTFRERMADYPVRIELLSRFRTRRQQQRVIEDLAAGSVDIVIGTHRLIQSDVAFKDLGLVVIDEEQRFGVLHKEKFKTLRKLVDVLTLSATPIPRTLYLALTGARDMSAIQTPPHDRLPVETMVVQYDERLIRDAILRELNRGGQVFFLHNRVLTIHTMEQKLRALVPQARIAVGHGQMDSDDLEDVMTRFVNGEADILLSTTIIESGLDIPNANTIIIDRADRFGLSDLYQLRGRVGRYKHQAYAYLLIPRHASLLADVRKRISAIKQYSTLGSGFKIAMRDLEIRGAGNLLGSEQSGHITAVGFDLYCQLLKQSVASLKGEKVKPRIEVTVRLDFVDQSAGLPAPAAAGATESEKAAAYLPHAYVPEPQHRIEIYRKLAQATDKPALEALTAELRDRFGPVPPPVELLLQIGELKMLAGERGITVMEVKEDKVMLTRRGDFVMIGGKFPRLTKKDPQARLKEIKRLLLAV
jgi:transcription-repair coupling factor (superfamily II helicase)